jgi:hypothetical protein
MIDLMFPCPFDFKFDASNLDTAKFNLDNFSYELETDSEDITYSDVSFSDSEVADFFEIQKAREEDETEK